MEPLPVSLDDDLNDAAKQVEVGAIFGSWYLYITQLDTIH